MKKTLCVILAFALILALFALPTSASGEVFVAVGNTVLPLGGAMPIYSSGVWYLDYQCFTKSPLNVSSSYNSTDRTLVLYTWDTTLIFNLNETTAYTAEEQVKYKAVAFTSSGTVYVPAQFTAQMLGFNYTYFTDIPLLRISRSSDIPSDMFQYIAEKSATDLLAAYNAEKQNTETGVAPPLKPTTEDNTPEQNTSRKYVALTFNITDGKNLSRILDALSRYGYRATFFVQGSVISEYDDALRRAVASGHTIGTLSENGDKDFSLPADKLTDALNTSNERLYLATKTKARLIRVPSGSKSISAETAEHLSSLGYRIWDQNVLPTSSSSTAIYNTVVSRVKATSRSTVVTLTDSDVSLNALMRLCRYFSENNYSVYAIDILDTPINDINIKK